jgi:RNA polymerase sigma-70 factor (ECF subfamily)
MHEGNANVFATTHWSVVMAAGVNDQGRAKAALETLCQTYWYPLYAYTRRQGKNHEDAQDLTQDFFARLLEKGYVAKADRNRGKFRSFLLSSMNNFMVNEWKRNGRIKRGGAMTGFSLNEAEAEERYGQQLAVELDATSHFDRQWAATLVERVLASLLEEYAAMGKAELFLALKIFIWGETSPNSYAELEKRLNLNAGTIKVAAHRLRKRFRERLRMEVSHTVARAEDIDEELRHLVSALR